MNGGYVMLDFKGISRGDIVDGLFDKCVNVIKTNKPTYICNLTYNNVTFSPVYVYYDINQNTNENVSFCSNVEYDGLTYTITIEVSNNGEITIL